MEDDKRSETDSVDSRDECPEEKKGTVWAVALVAIISFARIGHGLFISITGPTLLFLADNVNSDVKQVSYIFSGRSLGILVGAAVFSAIMNRFKEFRPLFSLGIGLAVNGIVMFVTPFMTTLAGLVVATTVGGLMFGYLDAGMQAVYLKLWGEKGSRPYIQSFHFGFSVGAFIAPVLAKPFLEKASLDGDAGTTCPDDGEETATSMYTTIGFNNTTPGDKDEFNPVNWCFIIIGVYTVIVSFIMTGLALCKIEEKVKSQNVETTESRPEEPLRDVWVFFIPLCFYYFCCVASETVYQGYIYSVALCSDLGFTVSDASLLNSLFWAGFGIGRGTGIVFSKYFKPSTIIIFDLIGTTLALTVMSIWGEDVALVTWIVTFFHGLCVATLYSSGVSWTSQVTNMAGTYIFVYNIGNAIGSMTMMPAGGALFEREPFSVMYLTNLTCGANIIFFALMALVARYRHRPDEKLDNEPEDKGKANEAYSPDASNHSVELTGL